MPLLIASLIFAVALSALPSTQRPDDEEYKQFMEYSMAKHQRRMSRGSTQSRDLGEARGEERKKRTRGAAFGDAPLFTDTEFIDPFEPAARPACTPTSSANSQLAHSLSFPSFSASSSPLLGKTGFIAEENERGPKGLHLRRSSSVPSFSSLRSSASSSPSWGDDCLPLV